MIVLGHPRTFCVVNTLSVTIITAYIIGLILVYIVARLLYVPLKLMLRLLVNGVIGLILLWGLNWVGEYWSLHIGINPLTALIAGFLGVPGVVLLIALRYLLTL